MTNIVKMSPEVLIYIQSLKRFLIINEEAHKYFELDDHEEVFFNFLSEMSQKNFEESGEPELTLPQFEEVREKTFKSVGKIYTATGGFISFNNLGHISLN